MSEDKVYNVPAEWARARLGQQREVPRHVQALGRGPRRVLGRARQARRLDQALHQGQEHLLCARATSPSNGTRTAPSTSAPTASTATCRSAATRSPSSGRATTRPTMRRSPTASCTSASASSPTCLKANGVKKGDRVTIYLPMIPEAAYAMLACARIGAVHSVVFGGFSPDSLAGRIDDAEFQVRHHGGRGRARRPPDPAQEEHRRGAEEVQGRREGAGRAPHRRRRALDRRAATSGCTRSW